MIVEYLQNILLITTRKAEVAAIKKRLADETHRLTRNVGKKLNHHTLRNNPEERRSPPLRGGSLKLSKSNKSDNRNNSSNNKAITKALKFRPFRTVCICNTLKFRHVCFDIRQAGSAGSHLTAEVSSFSNCAPI
jgi:hypothetical protein